MPPRASATAIDANAAAAVVVAVRATRQASSPPHRPSRKTHPTSQSTMRCCGAAHCADCPASSHRLVARCYCRGIVADWAGRQREFALLLFCHSSPRQQRTPTHFASCRPLKRSTRSRTASRRSRAGPVVRSARDTRTSTARNTACPAAIALCGPSYVHSGESGGHTCPASRRPFFGGSAGAAAGAGRARAGATWSTRHCFVLHLCFGE